jgi:hypothetical protein
VVRVRPAASREFGAVGRFTWRVLYSGHGVDVCSCCFCARHGRLPDLPRLVRRASLMPWSRAFHVPITTPDGLTLRTLRDAGEYIQALPRAKSQLPEWQTAAETLLAAVEGNGPLMFAEIAMRKALNAERKARS